ncbi:MAG: hypothetical protein PHI63_04620 [Patescibacteria group bacterium]|nr:hypothetical protein [Patescibacteria group bacterium]
MPRVTITTVLVGAGLALSACTQPQPPPAPTPQPTSNGAPVAVSSPTPPQSLTWEDAIDFARCQPGERRVNTYGLGSNSITIKGGTTEGNTCFLEYVREVEGAYTIYDCRVPAMSAPLSPGEFDVSKLCRPVRTGNFLSDTPIPE